MVAGVEEAVDVEEDASVYAVCSVAGVEEDGEEIVVELTDRDEGRGPSMDRPRERDEPSRFFMAPNAMMAIFTSSSSASMFSAGCATEVLPERDLAPLGVESRKWELAGVDGSLGASLDSRVRDHLASALPVASAAIRCGPMAIAAYNKGTLATKALGWRLKKAV